MADSTSVEGILSSSQALSQNIVEALLGIQSTSASEKASYDASIQRTKNIADNTATAVAVGEYSQVAIEKALTDFSVQASGDINDLSGTQARLVSHFNDVENERAKMLPGIQKKLSANILDDPIGWLTSQLTVDSEIATYNAKGVEAEQAQNQVLSINQMIDARFSALSKLKQTTSTAAAEAKIQIAKDAVLNNADALARQGMIAGTNTVKEIVALSGQQLQNRALMFDAEIKVANLADAQARLALATKADARDEERLKDFTEDRADKKQANEDTYNAVVRGMVASGASKKEMAEVSPVGIRNMMTGKTPVDPKMLAYYRLGKLNIRALPEGTDRIFGADPSSAIEIVSTLRPVMSLDMAGTYDRINKHAMEIVQSSKDPNIIAVLQSKDPVRIAALVNNTANNLLKEDETHTADPKSVYHLPGINSIVEMAPGLKELPLYSNILKPAIDAGVDLSDPTVVNSYTITGILAGKIRFSDAAGQLATIYRTGQKINLASKGVVALGLTPKESYIASSGTQIPFVASQNVDYTSAPDIARSWMSTLAAAALNPKFVPTK